MKLYKGITANDIRYLAFAPSNQDSITTLWAVTNKGVFKTTSPMQNAYPKNREMDAYKVFSYFAEEPSIEEIMKAAIKYAEVHPEKIEGWRKSASKRAWLPDLKVAYDRDKDRQRATISTAVLTGVTTPQMEMTGNGQSHLPGNWETLSGITIRPP